MEGVLGQGFFEEHLLTIEYRGQVLRIAADSLNATDPHIIAYDEHFQAPVRIGHIETVGYLDTGSTLSMLLPMAYAESIEATELVEAGVTRSADTEFHLYRATVLEPIILAGNTLTDLKVEFSERVPWVNIGSTLLHDHGFAVTIDQLNQRIRIAPLSGSD